ncbi:MAG TPA: efflux RND transporter periplasmic adaptor subunit [Candidatus Limnocylindrales bacterium]|nr:efflux RND transporter periplasmic adaptor subunit [Candidatus Limnocylindrales bacterium]
MNAFIQRSVHLSLAFVAALAVFLVASCSSKESEEPAPIVSVQAATVETKTIHASVEAEAVLYPRDQAAIVPRISAPIQKFYVQRGSRVHAGQLLAELANEDLRGALTENQGGYEQAEASYNSTLQSSAQDLKVAKEQLDAAQKLYDSRETLYQQGAMALKDVQDAAIALTQARNQFNLAEKNYNLKIAQGQLNSAKGKAISAEAQLNFTKIVSPINGVVTERPYYVGETPAAGSPILTVMDLSSVIARAHVSPQEAAELSVGDSASIWLGEGEAPIPAKVTMVSPALDPNSTTVQVWVEAPNPGDKLKPGSTVSVSIVSSTIKNALVIPADAIFTAADRTTSVMLIGSDGVAHQTAVKVGVRDGPDVQILAGLAAGQQVVTQGAYGLPDKTKVKISAGAPPPEPKD